MKSKKHTTNLFDNRILEDLLNLFERTQKGKLSKYDFPLVEAPFGFDEIIESIDSLIKNEVTMGKKVFQFERDFARYLGVKHAIMVNSGSSANLIALAILSNPEIYDPIKAGSKIIVPALSWSTSVFPILDINCVPVFIDSDKDTLNLNIETLKRAITKDTKAIFAVHLIGNPCALDELVEIAKSENLYLIEDCCEAHGAEFRDRKVGSWGDIGTFSFYYSHHITTIEGGMIVTNNDDFADLARCLRAHGWTRHLSKRKIIESKYPDKDPRFLFINRGYNLRPTEIQGAFGIHQLKKLDEFVRIRRECAATLLEEIENSHIPVRVQKEQENGLHSWFGFPLILNNATLNTKLSVINRLEAQGVETRPILAGNMANQPAMRFFAHKIVNELKIAQEVDKAGLFVGLNQNMNVDKASLLADNIIKAIRDEYK